MVNDECKLEAERSAKYRQKREMRWADKPPEDAVSTPSKASEPMMKLTTGSRIDRKRNVGSRRPCHRSQKERARRFFAAAGNFAFGKTLGLIASMMFSAAR